ncbi:uncharacterized protein KGF55_000138 [Candida pseudojiufengensis]|uniref:uncharacterized protein n=1 Tax=Candida pseudojiufengensis TaxID=497109 RepID=UPI002224C716|nr:uncharacterized protein KGF55_000138 [Candida pseudojiufengensis]KAI5966729.1 hypothetical protein KGF55_000138 [Candida pseudojiufengensis]
MNHVPSNNIDQYLKDNTFENQHNQNNDVINSTNNTSSSTSNRLNKLRNNLQQHHSQYQSQDSSIFLQPHQSSSSTKTLLNLQKTRSFEGNSSDFSTIHSSSKTQPYDPHHANSTDHRFSKTMPSTPMVEFDIIAKKKSLNKLNIRSQVFKNGILSPNIPSSIKNHFKKENNNQNFINDESDDELTSLHPLKTNDSYGSISFISKLNNSFQNIRNFYNDFTTIDWVKAYLNANKFNYSLKKNKWVNNDNNDNDNDNESFDFHEIMNNNKIPFLQKQYYILGKWILIILIGLIFSIIAFVIDKFEILLVGFKHGYCKTNWFASQISCCSDIINEHKTFIHSPFKEFERCDNWINWSRFFNRYWWFNDKIRIDYIIYVVLSISLACIACLITLTTKIAGGLEDETVTNTNEFHDEENEQQQQQQHPIKTRIIYTATGSGVPEVKTILSGFVIRRFLGAYTLFAKTIALILAIASGMSIGKEGPYVHLATCVGNILSRYFSFIYKNDLFEKELLSASASAGVALAFGSPLGGVLFILEEINNYLPNHQLFQIFFCAIISTLFLKFLNPYGTGKTVLFELEYYSDWRPIELLFFVIIGISGGIFGASFVKFIKWWPKNFRSLRFIKDKPLFEVFLIATITGLITFWNPYTKQASAELVLDLATSCSGRELDRSLCPTTIEQFIKELGSLSLAFIIKIILTFITFGLKIPSGIYVPSMVAGALYGRIFAMIIQWINYFLKKQTNSIEPFDIICLPNSKDCVDMGIYAMISAGAFMAGVTRMNITIVTILFELTSSYTYVLPISIAIAVANWSGGLLEKNSLYESLLISNDYPFMSPATDPIDPNIKSIDIINNDLLPTISKTNIIDNKKLFIDLSDSNYVSITILQNKLIMLANQCLLDGCIPLIKNQICIGLIYFSELEICLDKINSFIEEYDINYEIYCKLHPENNRSKKNVNEDYFSYGMNQQENEFDIVLNELTDLTSIVDTKPIFINYDSELALANLIFDGIGNRVIVLLKNGKYYGVLHKKVLIDYLRRGEND